MTVLNRHGEYSLDMDFVGTSEHEYSWMVDFSIIIKCNCFTNWVRFNIVLSYIVLPGEYSGIHSKFPLRSSSGYS